MSSQVAVPIYMIYMHSFPAISGFVELVLSLGLLKVGEFLDRSDGRQDLMNWSSYLFRTAVETGLEFDNIQDEIFKRAHFQRSEVQRNNETSYYLSFLCCCLLVSGLFF